MDIVFSIGKTLLKMTWWLVKFGLYLIAGTDDEDDRVPVCGPLEAYERLERNEISPEDFRRATKFQ